jgi:hypothetical protein
MADGSTQVSSLVGRFTQFSSASLPFPHRDPTLALGLFGSSEAEVYSRESLVTDARDRDSVDNGRPAINSSIAELRARCDGETLLIRMPWPSQIAWRHASAGSCRLPAFFSCHSILRKTAKTLVPR